MGSLPLVKGLRGFNLDCSASNKWLDGLTARSGLADSGCTRLKADNEWRPCDRWPLCGLCLWWECEILSTIYRG